MEEFLASLDAEQRALYDSLSESERGDFESQVTAAREAAAAAERTARINALASAAGTAVSRSVVHAAAPVAERGALSVSERAAQIVNAVVRGLSTDSAAELIDKHFIPEVMMTARKLTPFLDEARTLQVPMPRDFVEWPVLAAEGEISDNAQAEGVEYAGGSDATFRKVALTARKFGRIVPVSKELIEGSPIQVLNLLNRLFAREIAKLVEKHGFRGTGVNQPEGITVNANVVKVASLAATDEALAAELEGVFFALDGEYRDNGEWYVTRRGMERLNRMRTANGEKILGAPTQLAPFRTLLGRPVFETSGLVDGDDGAGNATTTIVFGDPSRYAVGMLQEAEVESDASSGFKQDVINVKVSIRYDAKVGIPEAFRVLTGVKL